MGVLFSNRMELRGKGEGERELWKSGYILHAAPGHSSAASYESGKGSCVATPLPPGCEIRSSLRPCRHDLAFGKWRWKWLFINPAPGTDCVQSRGADATEVGQELGEGDQATWPRGTYMQLQSGAMNSAMIFPAAF